LQGRERRGIQLVGQDTDLARLGGARVVAGQLLRGLERGLATCEPELRLLQHAQQGVLVPDQVQALRRRLRWFGGDRPCRARGPAQHVEQHGGSRPAIGNRMVVRHRQHGLAAGALEPNEPRQRRMGRVERQLQLSLDLRAPVGELQHQLL
jgi:hypothetical protein